MNNAKHTPGPLHLNGTYLPTGDGIGDGNNAYICTADGRQLAQMYRKHPQAQAYAPMLAAAPAMYEALLQVREMLLILADNAGDVPEWNTGGELYELAHTVRAALAQAEGR